MRTLGSLIVGSLAVMSLGASASDARDQADRPKGRIAYSNGNICIVKADGSSRRCLTHTFDDYGPAVWSFDGKRLAFTRSFDDPAPGGRSEVRILGANGRNMVNLTPRGMEDGFPAWSPVAPRIAWDRLDRSGKGLDGVYVANADGGGARRVVADPFAGAPAWSPDGRKLVFLRPPRGVFVVNAGGGAMRRLTRRTPSDVVQWSPDGRRLLFTDESATLDNHVFVMNADGSGLRRLTSRCASDYNPAWSPDSQTVAFVCDRKTESIFTVNRDGSRLRQLTQGRATYPSWSPDGKWIAHLRDGVWVMRSDGTSPKRVATNTFESQPTWDPRN